MAAALTDEEATEFATYVVMSLSGWRWSWPIRTVVELYRAPGVRYAPAVPLPQGISYGSRESLGVPRLHLSGRPVVSVASVRGPDGSEIPYTLTDRFTLTLDRTALASSLRGPDPEVEVTYSYGSEPPFVVRRAISVLAAELLASSSDEPCRLPERVTNVTRQGMSWTVIDPQDFLDDGRTGLYEVDLALSVANPSRARARARVFSPEYAPPRRVSTEMSGYYDLEVTPGTTFTKAFRYTLADQVTPATDRTGWTGVFQIREYYGGALVVEDAAPEIDPLTGRVTISLTGEQTALLTGTRYVYAIEVSDPSGEPEIELSRGVVRVKPQGVAP